MSGERAAASVVVMRQYSYYSPWIYEVNAAVAKNLSLGQSQVMVSHEVVACVLQS